MTEFRSIMCGTLLTLNEKSAEVRISSTILWRAWAEMPLPIQPVGAMVILSLSTSSGLCCKECLKNGWMVERRAKKSQKIIGSKK
jgi:hypothetical protein